MCSRPFRPVGLPIYVARVPAAPFPRRLPSRLCLLCLARCSLGEGGSLIPSAPFTDLHGSIGFVSIRVHSWLQPASRPVARSDSGWADQRDHLAFVPAVNAKILISCD